MLELLSAKDITKINVEYLKNNLGYTPKAQEVSNIHKLIVRERNWLMLTIEEWNCERPFNDILLNDEEKGYFLLDYAILFKYMDNLLGLDETCYDKTIINDFMNSRDKQ